MGIRRRNCIGTTTVSNSARASATARASASRRGACAGFLFLLLGVGAHAGTPIALENPTTASGGGVVEDGDIRLAFTIGEPAAGRVSAGPWTIVSGFLPTIVVPVRGDAIFSDSFESTDAP